MLKNIAVADPFTAFIAMGLQVLTSIDILNMSNYANSFSLIFKMVFQVLVLQLLIAVIGAAHQYFIINVVVYHVLRWCVFAVVWSLPVTWAVSPRAFELYGLNQLLELCVDDFSFRENFNIFIAIWTFLFFELGKAWIQTVHMITFVTVDAR